MHYVSYYQIGPSLFVEIHGENGDLLAQKISVPVASWSICWQPHRGRP